jgi:EpsI family protein
MFFLSIGFLCGVIFFLRDRQKPAKGKEAEAATPHMEPDEGNAVSNSRTQKKKVPLPYVMALLVFVGVFFFLQYRARTSDHIPKVGLLETFPDRIGSWQGQRFFLDSRLVRIFNMTNYTHMEYKDPDGKKIDFHVALYATQSKGKSIHTPETCLRVGDWRFKETQKIRLALPGYKDSPIRMKDTILTNGKDRWLTYFWFKCRGRNLVNAYELKFFNFWDRLISRRTDGVLIRVMTQISGTETREDAELRLQQFLGSALPILDTYMPS